MTLSAAGCVRRGLLNLRANWELVFFHWLQAILVTLLVAGGIVPLIAALGLSASDFFDMPIEEWVTFGDGFETLSSRGSGVWPLLLASFVIAGVIWLIGMLVYCYFQGGILGVLMAGDRQAPPGHPRSWQCFRTFSARDLRGWGARYLWRYFWLFNLFLLLVSLWLLLPFALVLLAVWGGEVWGTTAALGIGCGGALPLAFSMFVLAFWLQLAQAELAREESGVWSATGRSLILLGRRLGTVFLLGFLALFVSLSVGLMFGTLTFAAELALRRWAYWGIGSQLALSVVQWLVTSAVGVALASTLIGLVRSEARWEAGA